MDAINARFPFDVMTNVRGSFDLQFETDVKMFYPVASRQSRMESNCRLFKKPHLNIAHLSDIEVDGKRLSLTALKIPPLRVSSDIFSTSGAPPVIHFGAIVDDTTTSIRVRRCGTLQLHADGELMYKKDGDTTIIIALRPTVPTRTMTINTNNVVFYTDPSRDDVYVSKIYKAVSWTTAREKMVDGFISKKDDTERFPNILFDALDGIHKTKVTDVMAELQGELGKIRTDHEKMSRVLRYVKDINRVRHTFTQDDCRAAGIDTRMNKYLSVTTSKKRSIEDTFEFDFTFD